MFRGVILSEAKNLASKRIHDERDPSSPAAPQDDTPWAFFSQRLARARGGATVISNYSRRADAAAETVAQIENLGGRALAVRADVTDESQVRDLVQRALQAYGGLDLLVANAGGPTEICPTHELSSADWDRGLGLNCKVDFRPRASAGNRVYVWGFWFVFECRLYESSGRETLVPRAGRWAVCPFDVVVFNEALGFCVAVRTEGGNQ